MQKIRIICLCSILAMMLCACGEKQAKNQILTARDAGAPCSDWEKSNTGSAKYLDGSTVLVSIFLDDPDADWTEEDRKLVLDNTDIACDFLVEEGERYGRNVNLIYDFTEHPDLEYHFKYNKAFPGSTYNTKEASDDVRQFDNDVIDYVHTNISSQDIMEKYHVNSIGFLVFIDHKADAATAHHYWTDYQGYYYEEIAFINLRWESSGNNVESDCYAHEILHLFGARDLYYTSQDCGVTKEFVDYVAEKYPKEIMLGNSADVVMGYDSVSAEITNITAYFLGWKDYIAELEQFPSIKAKYPASFSLVQDTQGNYETYSLEARAMNEESHRYMIVTKILNVVVLAIVLAIVIRDILRAQKKKKEENTIQYYQ